MAITRIRNVKARAISIRRASTLTTAHGARDDATTVLVTITTEDGIVGLGQAPVDQPYYGETAEGMLANIRSYLAPAVAGQDPFDIERLNQLLRRALPGHGASQAAVEMALWDIKGKALGVPVYQLLGGKLRDGIAIMGAVTHAAPEAMAREADELLRRAPYPLIKIKAGLDVDADVRGYAHIIDAVGQRARMQVDANAGYTFGDALLALNEMARIGNLAMIDQPVARIEDMAELARRLPVPLMADESITSPADALDIITRRAASGAFLKIAKHGGLLNVQKMAGMFEAAGLVVSIGIYYDVIAAAAAHLAAALPAISWPSPFTDLTGTILTQPLVPDGLTLHVPTGPGLEVEIDPDLVEKHALSL
jgi:muconate cycloisomerase